MSPRLRSTLIALAAVVLLGLAFTAGFAFLGLSGPEDTVKRAVAAYDAAQYTESIRLLNRAEKSMGPASSPRLRARIFAQRRDAHLQVQNYQRANEDVARLAALGADHPDALLAEGTDVASLALDRVYYTLLDGQSEAGLGLAQQFLEAHPEHPRGLELAGEAAYAVFAEGYAELNEELDQYFDDEIARRADRALTIWLYRGAADPLAQEKRREFADILDTYLPGAGPSGKIQRALAQLEGRIAQAQDYCSRALVAPDGQPVAAYRLLRTSLEKGGRHDDIQALAESYLLRFDHVYTVDAAADLAELHVDQQRYRAAIEVVDRYLPADSWKSRVLENKLSAEVRRLFLAKARALYALFDKEGSEALAELVDEVQASGYLNLLPELHLIRAFALVGSHRAGQAMPELHLYRTSIRELPMTDELRERGLAAAVLSLELGRRLSVQSNFSLWQTRLQVQYADDAVEPLLALAERQLENDEATAALGTANDLESLIGHDDRILRVRARARDRTESDVSRSASTLLDEFVRNDRVPARISHSVLWPLVAELALERENYEIALEAARNGSTALNWARWPRLLEARAAMKLGKPLEAKQAIERLLSFHPNDPEGLAVLAETMRALGESTDTLIYDSLRAGNNGPIVAQGLLAAAWARGDRELAESLASTMVWRCKDDASAQLAIAEYFLATSQVARARAAVERAVQTVTDPTDPDFARARASQLLIATIQRDQQALPLLLEQTKILLYGQTDEIERYARSLAQLDQNYLDVDTVALQLAYDLMRPVFSDPIHQENRGGKHYEFGAQLALRLGLTGAARDSLKRALAFSDNEHAAETLTLLELSENPTFDTSSLLTLQRPTGLPTATLLARDPKRQAATRLWVRQRIIEQPFDLPALCLAAILDPTAASLPAELTELVTTQPLLLLDTLTFVDAPGFEKAAVARAFGLVQAAPTNRFALALLARAYANGGSPGDALTLLGQLMVPRASDGAERFLWAHEEVARLLSELQVNDDALIQATVGQFTSSQAPTGSTPRRDEFVIRSLVAKMGDSEVQSDFALSLLTNLWNAYPGSATGADVRFLAEKGRPDLALQVYRAAESELGASDRAESLEVYFELIEELAAKDPESAHLARAQRDALRVVADEGAYGAAVHFLLSQQGAIENADGSVDTARRDQAIQWLTGHFRMFLADRDRSTARLAQSVRMFAGLVDSPRLLKQIETLLRHDPSVIELWSLKARELVRAGRTREAYDALTWVEYYLPRHPARFDLIELSTRLGEDRPKVEEQMRKVLGDEAWEAPERAFVRGMLALRGAQYATAAAELARSEPQPDGAHLYFAALAELARGNALGSAELFGTLARDYPMSLLAENAGEFAKLFAH